MAAPSSWNLENKADSVEMKDHKTLEFEDNFRPEIDGNNSERLPDSDVYLNRLENRLKKVKGLNSRKNLMEGLKEARESVMVQLTNQSSDVDFETENNSKNEISGGLSYIEQKLFPDKVAINTEELLHLVKADVLQKITEMSNDDNNSNDD